MLQIQNLSFQYENHLEKLFSNICFDITKEDRIGLIGPNGAGKSTLIQILLGKLAPGKKSIISKSQELSIAYLPQDFDMYFTGTLFDWMLPSKLAFLRSKLRDMESSWEEQNIDQYDRLLEEFEEFGGYTLEHNISSTLFKMGFSEQDLELKYENLSSGQHKRAAISKLFTQKADLFILDEPTNHLDFQGIELLERFLTYSSFTFIMITHDRVLLDKTTNKIFELQYKNLSCYSGNYSFFCEQKEQEEKREWSKYQDQQKTLSKLQREFRQRKSWAIKREKEKIGAHAGDRGFIGHRAAKMMQRAKNARKRQEHILERHQVQKPRQEKPLKGVFCKQRPPGNFILQLEGIAKSFGSKKLFEALFLHIDNGERIVFTGPNGCGKSTLLKIIQGQDTVDTGEVKLSRSVKIASCSQNRDNYSLEQTILEVVRTYCKQSETICRIVLGELGLSQRIVYRTLQELSLGERTKVELAVVLLSQANLLVLDEPTNHLDLRMREALEKALQEYPGTIIFTSHDRYFVEKLATREISLE